MRGILQSATAASMRAITSGVSFVHDGERRMFSRTCAGRLAPVITVDTAGILQAPRKRHLRERAPEVRGDRRELLHLRDLRAASVSRSASHS